jgi:hypothetical protein
MSEVKASHSQRMWAEVSSFTPHFLYSGLSSSPSRWRCRLRVLCPVSRPVTALDWVLLKDKNLALAPRLGPEISSRACLWVSLRPRHLAQCWLTNQRPSLLFYILSRNSQGRFRSKESPTRAVPCELIGDLVASYSSMSRDRVYPYCMRGRDISFMYICS